MPQVTIKPQEFEDFKINAGDALRVTVKAAEEIDIGVLAGEAYRTFCWSDDGAEIVHRVAWHEEADAAEFIIPPQSDTSWLILWNAYEDEPVAVEFSIAPA